MQNLNDLPVLPDLPDLADLPDLHQSEHYQAISLRNITTAAAAVLSALQNKFMVLDIGSDTWRLRFSAQPGLTAGSLIQAQGEWLGHRITLWFPQVLLQRTLQICMPDLSAAVIPPALFPAMASNAIGAWLDTLPHRESLRIDTIEEAAQMPAVAETGDGRTRHHLLARRNAPSPVPIDYAIAIDIDPALAAALPKLCAGLSSDWPEPSQALLSLPLQLQCEVGRVTVPYSTLDALQYGDILFFNPYIDPDNHDLSSLTVQLSYRQRPLMQARIQQPDLMVITDIDMNDRKSFLYDDLIDESASDPFHTIAPLPQQHADEEFDNEPSDTDTDTEPLPSTSPALPAVNGLNQLPLQLVFDVGNCEMSFAELQKLQPGNVIPLASRMPELVRVSVNGRVIASGELVEIDGRIGVMLARIADIQ
ncbi:MAG: YscQ/HrcQ family type secretion apparatus protein [Herbaspirillum sp.]|nr:YscQ/HrcQ family type secretion apparatus protein [Herbaspirillum sp.]